MLFDLSSFLILILAIPYVKADDVYSDASAMKFVGANNLETIGFYIIHTSSHMRCMFTGAQHWYESGWYGDAGFKEHYDGYFCLCECNGSPEGIFCKGGGVQPSGEPVASFLGVFSQDFNGVTWTGSLVAYDNTKPFADTFTLETPGGKSNYTGVSQSLGAESFVW